MRRGVPSSIASARARCLAAVVAGLAIAAAAAPARGASGELLARDFPAGSIVSRTQAERALEAARELEARSNRDWDAAQIRCAREFFVNRCIDAARRERNAALVQVRRVRVEANSVQRRLDAEQRASDLAERRAREAQHDPGKAAVAPPSGNAGPARSAEEIERARLKHAELESAQKKRLAEEEARAPERAASARRFEERQREAAAHARAKEQERIDNEKRRAERSAAREKDATERQPAPPPVRPPG